MTNLNNKKEENLNYTRPEYPDDLRRYEMPPQPYTRNMRLDTIWDARDTIEDLERAYGDFRDKFKRKELPIDDKNYYPEDIATGVLRYLGKEYITSAKIAIGVAPRDIYFEDYMYNNEYRLVRRLERYIGRGKEDVKDDCGGLNDIAHLAFSTLVKLTRNLVPDHWGSWGGDLASGMGNLTIYCRENPRLSVQRLSDSIIGAYPGELSRYLIDNRVEIRELDCNFTDLCDDADSIALARDIDRNRRIFFAVSNAISRYYDRLTMRYRFQQYEHDGFNINSVRDMKNLLISKVKNAFPAGKFHNLKKGASDYEQECACDSLANYIYEMCR